jgi:hypothetical protein
MTGSRRTAIRALIICAVAGIAASAAQAGTILKLNLADVGPDVGMNGLGIFQTIDDGNAATLGDQNTNIEFTGFLDFIPDVQPNIGSFSMHNLQELGPANVVGGTIVVQNFTGGNFQLYDPANTLLLSGQLGNSAVTGVIGPPGTGALFTTTFSAVTGGTLAPQLAPNSLQLSMNMTNVNGGAGFGVAGGGPALNPFLADASVNIGADPAVPEPGTLALIATGACTAIACAVRRRR